MDLREALETAIRFEREIRDHYAQGSKTIRDAQGKRAFEVLAREEQEHVSFLQACLARWKSEGLLPDGCPPPAFGQADAWRERARGELEAHTERKVADDREVALLKTALDLENRTAAFYERMIGELPEDQRSLFRSFLEVERGHGLIVQAELDAVAGLGFWFGVQEFRNPGV